MKKIICLWGGPGSGKSTTCAGIFYTAKDAGVDAEMNREYIKDWVWEGRDIIPGDQSYIFTKQARKERLYMRKGIELIVTDSPMALSIVYGDLNDSYEKEYGACRVLLKQHHAFCKDMGYKVDHYLIERKKEYNSNGRFQTKEEAENLDNIIKSFLDLEGFNYETLTSQQIIDKIKMEF